MKAPTFGDMLAVELWLSLIYAWYNGAMVVALTELIPASVRTAGFSLAYSLATTLGGSSLLISTWLIQKTGDNAAPGYWMSFAALCGRVSARSRNSAPACTAPAWLVISTRSGISTTERSASISVISIPTNRRNGTMPFASSTRS